ncbi:hypothetical protein C8R45DRAFT_1069621 [Mycena sanguinolenta]|nr:hypothetical protein C8R45DRAFT_1069621 [Mycena sanguinolenta]
MAGTSAPRRPGRPNGSKNASTVPKKRSSPKDDDYEDLDAKKRRKNKDTPANNTPAAEPVARPHRAAWQENPGLIDAPRPKRSHEQVEATKAAEEDRIAREQAKIDSQRADYIAQIAALNAAQDKLARDQEQNRILTLEDLDGSDSDEGDCDNDDELHGDDTRAHSTGESPVPATEEDVTMEFTEQDFEHVEDEDAYHSPNEYEKPKEKPKAPVRRAKKSKKAPKGETRDAIEAAAKILAQNEEKSASVPAGKKKGVQNSDAAAASNRAGISKRWTAATSTQAREVSPPVSPGLGGLNDADAAGTRPKKDQGVGTRRNESVAIDLAVSSDAEDTPTRVPGRQKKVVPVPKQRKPATAKTDTPSSSKPSSKLPALRVNPGPTPKVKPESSGTFDFTPPSHADVNGMPAFIATTWTSKYLPEVQDSLHRARRPMHLGTASAEAETIAVLQEVLDRNYPGSGYCIKAKSPIYLKAIARMGERRGAYGKGAIKAVDEIFKAAKYYRSMDDADDPATLIVEKVREDATYALRFNGPALYKLPTPRDCTLEPEDEGYIKPKDFLESRAFIETVKPLLKNGDYKIVRKTDGEKTTLDLSFLPVGAMIMGAVAVERAYTLHARGDRATNVIPDFSATNYATAAAGYLESIEDFSERRWTCILAALGLTASVSDTPKPRHSLDGRRERMYIPSSP